MMSLYNGWEIPQAATEDFANWLHADDHVQVGLATREEVGELLHLQILGQDHVLDDLLLFLRREQVRDLSVVQ